jgi:Tol biopolymer transport system component
MYSENYSTKILSVMSDRNLASLIAVVLSVILFAPGQAVFAQRYSDWSAPLNLGQVVNTTGFDGCPSVTKDGLNLLFMSTIGSTQQNLYVSHRESTDPNSAWSAPESLGPDVNTAAFGEICPNLSISGRYLYFASNRPGGCGDFDIYVSRRVTKTSWNAWSEPENLGCSVNSAGPEFSPSLFEDEDGSVYLYFSSGLRAGGQGFGDIWVSKLIDGSFGAATPVVELNTPSNDLRPKIRVRDGLEIFFDSNRPGAMLQDLYTSTRECTSPECPWSVPVSLGAIVNSSSIDGGPALSFDGTELYFMSNRPGGSGDQDIWVARREKLTRHRN